MVLTGKFANMFVIQQANISDIPSIAALLVQTWKSSYQGVLPAAFLDSLDVSKQISRHEKYFESHARYLVVRHREVEIIGFCSYGLDRSPATDSEMELYTLYVDINYQRRGLGKQLLDAVLEDIQGKSPRLKVSVLKKNPYLTFYLKQGFEIVGSETIDFGAFMEDGLILEREI